jgi:hypothetical protein
MMLIDARVSNSGVAYYFRTYPSGGTGYTLEFYDGAGNRRSSTYFPLNRWTHIALTRTGGVLRSFTNGVMETLVASGYGVTLNPGSTTPRIGENSTALSNPVTGYMSNFRIVKGTAVYTASFTPPTQDLTAISNTLLLTCQASNATGTSSTTIIDNSANNYTITITGDIKKTTVNPYGGMYATNPYDTTTNTTTKGSMHFDGTGDYLTPPTGTQYNLGTGDFTIEAWVYPTSYNSGYNSIIDARTSNSTTPYVFGLTITGYVEFYDGAYRTSTGIAPVGTWSHVAVSRNSGTLRIFLNGVIVYTLANYTTSLNPGSITPRIGGHLSGDAANFIGYISNFRLVNGTAVYTAAFTPSNAALSSVSDTLLLVKGNTPDVVDSSTKSTIEMVGQVKATSKVKKYGGNSLHFDGTGDYLSSPSSQDFNFGTGDFTIEMWVYRNRTSTAETLIDFRSANASQIAPWIYIDASNVLNYNVSAASRINSGATTLTTGVWYHIAVTRSGTSTKMFINGTQVGSTYTDSNTYIQSPVTIGWGRDTTALSGYMDDIRVTKGVARYTANFTAPTAEFPKK